MRKKLTALLVTAGIVLSCGFPAAGAGGAEAESARAADDLTDPPVMQEVYEAEEAQRASAPVGKKLDDYSAAGYVEYLGRNGAVAFTVTVPTTGNYGVRLRYTNGGSASQKIAVYVGEEKIADSVLNPTINWNTWDTELVSLPLKAGKNVITYMNESSDVLDVRLDKISLSWLYEAEDAEHLGGMGDNKDHSGYSGSGFAAGFQNDGHGVKFSVNAPKSGEYALVLRYAAGDTDSIGQSISLYVNGSKSQEVVSSLRSWDLWGDLALNIDLKEGANEIIVRRDQGDAGQINLDYITVKEVCWTYPGAINKITGEKTSELTLSCENAEVRLTSVDPNAVKVWVDPEGKFSRKYESFTVVNDAVDPQQLTVSDKKDYYLIDAGAFDIRAYKDSLRLVYVDKAGNILMENDAKSMGWTTDGELEVNNKLPADEQFYGLGEKVNSFSHRGRKLAMWAVDAYGDKLDSSFAEWDNGRWYMATTYFVSSKGYGILFDNSSRTVFDFGNTSEDRYSFGTYNPNPGGDLIYYFIYGPEMKKVTKTYTDMSGKSFFAPEWAYGNMQCHYGYKQSDIERVASTYREKQIPLEVIIADIEWYEYLCTPTQWSKSNYPDPEGMFKKLNELNVRMGLINDPNVTNRDNNADYVAGDQAGYFVKDQTGSTKLVNWPWGAASGLTDFFNPSAAKWWGEQLNMILDQGVSYFWLDMNEPARYNTDWLFWNEEGKAWGTLSEVKNAYAIKHQQAVYDKVTENGNRAMLQTRSGYTGSHRYAAPWTGDINGGWGSMHEQIMMGTGLSVSGYNYWGFDIGGFFSSLSDDQYKRWVELATFTPVHRFHYCAGVEEKEPWTHNSEDLSRDYINLRYTLVPYMYSYSADSIIGIGIEEGYGEGGTGIPLVRPMVMEYPEDKNTYNIDTQFMCGESFLVAPVVESATTKEVYLPEGNWYDYDDCSTVYTGGRWMTYDAPVELLPVFVKEGSIIPMQSERQYMDDPTASPDVTLDIYPTVGNGAFDFVLYEDDGKTDDYAEGVYATTSYDCKVVRGASTDTMTLTIGARDGKFTDIADRSYMLQFHNATYGNLSVRCDGTSLNKADSLAALEGMTSGFYADKTTGICYVRVADTAKAQTIVLSGDAGTNEGMVYEAEEADPAGLTGAVTKTVDGRTVVTGLGKDTVLRFENVVPQNDGVYSVEVVYAGGSTGSTVSLDVDDIVSTVHTESSDWSTAIGVVELFVSPEDPDTLLVKTEDSSLMIDKIIISRKATNIEPVEEYSLLAVDGEAGGKAEMTDKGVTLSSDGDSLTYPALDTVCAGEYAVRFRYFSSSDSTVKIRVGEYETTVNLAAARNADLENEVTVNLPLALAGNTIQVTKTGGGSVTLRDLHFGFEPYSLGSSATDKLTNPGFEEGSINGWSLTALDGGSTTGGYGVDGYDIYSGSRKFYFFDGDKAMNRLLSQKVTGLENGTYVVRAKTRLYNSTAYRALFSIRSGDKSAANVIPRTGEWTTSMSDMIEVTDGTLEIGFIFDAPGGSSLQIDDVELYMVTPGAYSVSTDALANALSRRNDYPADQYEAEAWKNYQTAAAIAEVILSLDEDEIATGVFLFAVKHLARMEAILKDSPREEILLGDVDGDNQVTVSDVVQLRKLIVAGSWTDREFAAGNLDDSDENLTVSDVVALRALIVRGV